MNEIERLQEHLLLVRRTVGWTAEEFGERIGVTRQTINNLEAGRNKLNKTQYIAMRSVLDAEMNQYPEETEMLKLILDVFIDNPESYSEEEKEKLLSKANMVAPSILAGSTSRKDVSKEIDRKSTRLNSSHEQQAHGCSKQYLIKKIGEVSHGRIRKEKEKERDEIPIG